MSKKNRARRTPGIVTLFRMFGLVKPLAGYMVLAVLSGTLAFLAVQFIPVLGGCAILDGLGLDTEIETRTIWILLPALALARAVLRFTEQRLNHYIAFRILAVVRDRVFGALRRLCPARLEGRDKGDLVALITADVELLEVFYAHTISPICILADLHRAGSGSGDVRLHRILPHRAGGYRPCRLSVRRHCRSAHYLGHQRGYGRKSAAALGGTILLCA